MQMPMGIHKGKPIDELPTTYLAWLVSQDAIRFARWPVIEHIVGVLAERFGDPAALLDELRVTEPPPARWKTAEREAARKEARAAKLAALEERRRAKLKHLTDGLRERIERNRQPSLEPAPGVWRDASYFAREASLRKADTDVSDLV